jgi:hypothetical protein
MHEKMKNLTKDNRYSKTTMQGLKSHGTRNGALRYIVSPTLSQASYTKIVDHLGVG